MLLDEDPECCGPCSDVYRAKWRGTLVAVKVIRVARGATDVDAHHRITKIARRELQVWVQLDHPNIHSLRAIASPFKRSIAFVSEWIEGGCARDYVKSEPVVDYIWLITEIAQGLHYLHTHNIVHGDLKGTNILIDTSHTPKRVLVTDFGLSKALGFAGYTTTAKGTFPFMARELHCITHSIAENEVCALTYMSDIWAWGMTAYELFTHQFPFEELKLNTSQLIMHIADGNLPSYPGYTSSAAKRGLTTEVWLLLEKCWEFDPKARPPSLDILECLKRMDSWVAWE